MEHLREENELGNRLANIRISQSQVSEPSIAPHRSSSFSKLTPEEQQSIVSNLEEVKTKFRAQQHQQANLLRRRQAGELSGSGRVRYVSGSRSSTVSVPGSDASDSVYRNSSTDAAPRAPLGALDMNDPMTIATWLVRSQLFAHFHTENMLHLHASRSTRSIAQATHLTINYCKELCLHGAISVAD